MKFLQKHKFYFSLIIVSIAVFVWWFNTFTLTVANVDIATNKIKDEIKIVQLTDLHGATFGKNNSRLISKIAKQNPDVIVITGDMYSYGDLNGRKVAVNLIQNLASNYPVYVVNGEHDNSQEYIKLVEKTGAQFLHYDKQLVNVKKSSFYLYGITNVWYSETFDLSNEFDIDTSYYNILLAHIDNFEKFSEFSMDLSICGDTHGGQIRIPFYGPLYFEGDFFPKGKCYDKGYFTDGKNSLFVSSGLGNYPIKFRLFNRPEIAVITINNNEK